MAGKKTPKRRKDAPYLPPGVTRRDAASVAMALAREKRAAILARTAASRAALDKLCKGVDMSDLAHLAVFEVLPPRTSAVASMATDATHVAPDRPPMPPVPAAARAFVLDENYVRPRNETHKARRVDKKPKPSEICAADNAATKSEYPPIIRKLERWARPPAEKPPEAIFTF